MDTNKVNRIEVINHTDKGEHGRAFTYWSGYSNGIKNPKVTLDLQDDGKTLKVFIENQT